MTAFSKKHSLSIVLTIFAWIILRNAYLETSAGFRWDATAAFNPFLEQTGRWAIRFLLISLSATPLRLLTGWNWIIRIRKPAGLMAFGFAVAHAAVRIQDIIELTPGSLWSALTSPWHIAVGVVAFIILFAMAITSNRFAMRQLKKNWKRLHRLVYPASLLALAHAIINTYYGKRQLQGPEVRPELFLYLAILIVLLVMRLPVVRTALRSRGRPSKRAVDLQTSSS